MGVVGLVYGTSSNSFYNVDAALTAPTSYDIGFDGIGAGFAYTTAGSSPSTIALFDRTADGVYYNYYHRFRDTRFGSGGMHSNIGNYNLPDGLDITMEFKRSNTSWQIATPYSGYYSDDTKIGSNNAVGTLVKFVYKFENLTPKNYKLFIDVSSGGGYAIEYFYDNVSLGTSTYTFVNSALQQFIIPSYSSVEFRSTSTAAARYLDAWYLQDLGVSASYQNGYDDAEADYDIGYDDGYADGESDMFLTGGLPGMISSIFDALTGIMNVVIFGSITLGGLMLFPLVVSLFVFIMKMVKAG